jgi:cytoskeletal protein CcmA (bactofilin family)
MFEMNPMTSNASRSAEAHDSEKRRDSAPGTKLQNLERPATIAMIGPTIQIKGDVSGEESLVIQGHVEGTINLKKNNLIIGQEGKVTATIHAHTITIEGDLKGDVFGEERVIVKKTGKVRGNISAPQVSLEEGAKFKGSMDMDYNRTTSSATRKDTESASVVKFDASAGTEKSSFKQSGDLK